MSKPNDFRFFIYSVISGIDTYYTASSGSVSTTTTKEGAQLEYAPEEWDDVEKVWARSSSLHGIFTKLSNEYKFVGDGATILKHIIFTKGYDAKAKLLVEVVNDNTWEYETFSINDIDLSKPPSDLTSVTVSLFDNGIGNDFKANLDTPYEIPLTGSDVITVEHEGTTVKAKYNYRYGDITTFDLSYIIGGSTDSLCVTLLSTPTTSEGLRPVAAEKTCNTTRMMDFSASGVGGAFYGIAEYDNFWLEAGQDIGSLKVNYKATIDWVCSGSTLLPTPYNVRLKIKAIISKKDEPFRASETIYTSATYDFGGAAVGRREVIDVVDYDLGNINVDERVYLIICPEWVSGGTVYSEVALSIFDNVSSRVSFDFVFNTPISDVQGFRLHKLLQKTVEAFADGKYGITPFASTFLSDPSSVYKGAKPYQTIITNGNALKGILDSVFKLSMKDQIEDIQSNYGMGIGISGGQLIAERITEFYRDDITIVDLGELTNWSIEPLNKTPTLIVIGNKYDNDNDVLNGSYDYNTKTTFKSQNISETENRVEYVSPIVSSIYNIERMRVAEAGKDTTGNKVNDSLYKLAVVETAVDDKYKLNYEGASGGGLFIAYDTLGDNPYNVEFSPQNMRIRLNEILYSNAYPSTTEITFQKSDRYKGMSSVYYDYDTASYTSVLYEDGNISPDDTELLWLPFIAKFQSVVPINFDALTDANPYGKVIGTVNGKTIHGYILSAKMKPSNRNIFDWEVLLTPSTNIEDLIF